MRVVIHINESRHTSDIFTCIQIHMYMCARAHLLVTHTSTKKNKRTCIPSPIVSILVTALRSQAASRRSHRCESNVKTCSGFMVADMAVKPSRSANICTTCGLCSEAAPPVVLPQNTPPYMLLQVARRCARAGVPASLCARVGAGARTCVGRSVACERCCVASALCCTSTPTLPPLALPPKNKNPFSSAGLDMLPVSCLSIASVACLSHQ